MLERGERIRLVRFAIRDVARASRRSSSLVLLVWRESTIKEPVINFRVFKSRQLAAGVTIAAFLGFALYGSVFVLPIFLQGLHGFTANQTGTRDPARRARVGGDHGRSWGGTPRRIDARVTVRARRAPVPRVDVQAVACSRSTPARATCSGRSCCAAWALGSDLRAAHRRDHGRAQAESELAAGHGHVQPHAPARRFARHRHHAPRCCHALPRSRGRS